MRTITLLFVFFTSLLLVLEAVQAKSYFSSRKLAFQPRTRFCPVAQQDLIALSAVEVLRGGASKKATEEESDSDDEENVDDADEESDTESDVEKEDEDEEDTEDEYDADEYDDEYDDEEEEEGATSVTIADKGEIVEPYFVSPQIQLYVLFGSMMIARKMDLFNPIVVKTIRFLFVVQLIVQQAFIFYVRIMAKKNNDRTPIQQKNPLSEILQKQMGQQAGGNDMVKNLASSFLSSETTVMEYDMKQASNMQGGILFNMIFNWFLHFKLKKTQPVLTQIMSSTLQLVYHPLFQVYILGRNLERPFKSQMMMNAEKMKEAQGENGKTDEDDETEAEDEEEEEEDDDDNDEEEQDEESEDDDTDTDGGGDEEDDEVTQSEDEDNDDEEDEDSSSS